MHALTSVYYNSNFVFSCVFLIPVGTLGVKTPVWLFLGFDAEVTGANKNLNRKSWEGTPGKKLKNRAESSGFCCCLFVVACLFFLNWATRVNFSCNELPKTVLQYFILS